MEDDKKSNLSKFGVFLLADLFVPMVIILELVYLTKCDDKQDSKPDSLLPKEMQESKSFRTIESKKSEANAAVPNPEYGWKQIHDSSAMSTERGKAFTDRLDDENTEAKNTACRL